MKFKVLAVSLSAFFTFAGMAQAVVAVPTQLKPNEGETVYVDPVSGVTLKIGVTPEDAGLFPERMIQASTK